jgi:methyltransferase-like protein 23
VNKQKLSPPDFITQAELQTLSIEGNEVHLFIPNAGEVQEAYQQGKISFPYWSKIWPAAIAMAEYLVLHPGLAKEKKVLEIGAGLGLPSLIAARYAATVTCTDHAKQAVAFAKLSAAHNGLVNFHAAILDWNELPEVIEADVVLLSDINYEPVAFDALMKMVFSFLENGKTILLSNPQRLMAKEFIGGVMPYCKQQENRNIMHHERNVTISLMVLQK